jgi:hypothetical protein
VTVELDKLLFFALAAVWLTAIWAATLFIRFGKDSGLKRRLFPKLTVVLGILTVAAITVPFIVFGAVLSPFVYGTAAALFAYRMIRGVRFCDGCGNTVGPAGLFRPPSICPKCGTDLASQLQR